MIFYLIPQIMALHNCWNMAGIALYDIFITFEG